MQNYASDDGAKKADASDSGACDSETEAAPAATDNYKLKKPKLDQIIEAQPRSEVLIDPPEAKAAPKAWT